MGKTSVVTVKWNFLNCLVLTDNFSAYIDKREPMNTQLESGPINEYKYVGRGWILCPIPFKSNIVRESSQWIHWIHSTSICF